MKNWILGLLFLSYLNVAGQEKECANFKHGKFQIIDERVGNSTLERRGSKQIEYGEKTKMKLEFKVRWLDPCTYTLELEKILENPNRIQLPQEMILTVEILETKKNSYVQRSSSNLYDLVFESEIFRLE